MTTTSTERDIHFIDCVRHTLFNVGNMFIDIVNHVTIHRIEFICAVEISLDMDMAIIRQFSSRSNLHFVPFYSISFVIRSHHHQWYRCFREWARLLVLIIVKSGICVTKTTFIYRWMWAHFIPFSLLLFVTHSSASLTGRNEDVNINTSRICTVSHGYVCNSFRW